MFQASRQFSLVMHLCVWEGRGRGERTTRQDKNEVGKNFI